MLKTALTTALLACASASVFTLGPLAAQEQTAGSQRGVNTMMMRINPPPNGEFVLSWASSPATCSGEDVPVTDWIAAHPQFAAKKLLSFPVTLGFTVSADGRAQDIHVIEGGYVAATLSFNHEAMRADTKGLFAGIAVRDLMPSLRASRFAVRAPKSHCRIVYTPEYTKADEAARTTLAALGAAPRVMLSAARRDQMGGGDCNTQGWPAPLLRAYPDFRRVAAREGARKWSWVRFDIDENGVPTNATVIASSGDPVLDAEGVSAARATRVAGGPRSGCVAEWWRGPGIIPAPPTPDQTAFPGYRSCNALRSWDKRPELAYPQAYNERQIEGWAVLGFDVAADGAVENIRVLAAQPSEEFGSAGTAVLGSGRFARGDAALTRCIEQIRFVITTEAAPTSSR